MLAAIVSKNKGLISDEVLNDIIETIGTCFDYKAYRVPKDADIDRIIRYTKNDKKVVGDRIKFILLRSIGDAFIDMDVTEQDMIKAFKEYGKYIDGGN
jgi:3-dehydroquinate synthase